jgi:hypothetical protein
MQLKTEFTWVLCFNKMCKNQLYNIFWSWTLVLFGLSASGVLKLAFNLAQKMGTEDRSTKDKRRVGQNW